MIKVKNIDPVAVHEMMTDAGCNEVMMVKAGLNEREREPIRSGFIVEGMSFRKLCKSISEVDGVTFTDRRHFFRWSDQIKAEFTFQGNQFVILPDPWDDALWVQATTDDVDKDATLPIQKHITKDANSTSDGIRQPADGSPKPSK